MEESRGGLVALLEVDDWRRHVVEVMVTFFHLLLILKGEGEDTWIDVEESRLRFTISVTVGVGDWEINVRAFRELLRVITRGSRRFIFVGL